MRRPAGRDRGSPTSRVDLLAFRGLPAGGIARFPAANSATVGAMARRSLPLVSLALSCALVLAACPGADPADSSGSDSSDPNPSTGSTESTGVDPTAAPTTSTGSTSSTASSDTTDTDVDPTGDTDSDTGTPGLVCPLVDGPGVSQLALAPALFGAGMDPSDTPSCAIVNPERGFHRFVDLRGLGAPQLEAAAADGLSVVYGRVLLSDFRESPLDDDVLAEISAGFELVRAHGMKVVPRFQYSAAQNEPDAELSRILGHIEQLAPLLAEHADVILTLQAGFIGAWGEWHSSQHGLDAPEPRKQILDALLAALPAERTVSVRRPSFKEQAYAGPLTPETAHGGDALARVGHVNDCFLASDDDAGTYQEPGEKDYGIADSAFVPVGGETCALNPPRSSCPSALDELALHHWTYLNDGYHEGVLESWQEDGCYAEIVCRLGYRLAVTELRWAASAAAGDVLPVTFELVNDGFAAPVHRRPFALVLDGPARVEAPAEFDVRTALAGETRSVCVDAALPADLPPGTYRIGLRLADAAPALADDVRQAIRLANDDIEWSEGINWFDAAVDIE